MPPEGRQQAVCGRMHVHFGLATNTPGGWREGMAKDGILMEVPSGRIVYPRQMGQLLSIL